MSSVCTQRYRELTERIYARLLREAKTEAEREAIEKRRAETRRLVGYFECPPPKTAVEEEA